MIRDRGKIVKSDFDQTTKPGARLQSSARVQLEGREMLIPSAVSRNGSGKRVGILIEPNLNQGGKGGDKPTRKKNRNHANDNC